MIIVNRDIEIALSPLQLADEFWSMDAIEQAQFFNHLANISGVKFYFQADYIVNDLDENGKRLIKSLHERLI